MTRIHFWASVFCLAAASMSADEVLFHSGDRLSGTVVSVAGGKMIFASKVAGKVTLDMADIKTFATDATLDMTLTNGSIITRKVAAGEAGQVVLQSDGAAQPQTIALAEVAKINPEKVRWTGAIVAGAVVARGNTESDTANVSADAVRRSEVDRTTLGAGYRFANQRDKGTGISTTTEENWFLKGQYDYFFSKKFFGYGNIKYEKDRIARIDRRISAGVGAGYQWVEGPAFNFFTEGGLTWVFERYPNVDLVPLLPTGDGSWLLARLNAPPDAFDYMAARLAYHLDWTLNSQVKTFHNLELLPSLEDAATYLINADAGLRSALTARMFAEAKVQMAYNSQPNADREKKDLRYILGVGVSF